MSKGRKHRKDNRNYDEMNEFNNMNPGLSNLASILGNIDINQITSLLNSTGILNSLSNNNSVNEDKSNGEQKESSGNLLDNIDLGQLISQANTLNSMIVNGNSNSNGNVNEPSGEERRERHGKNKSNKERNYNQQQPLNQNKQDSVTGLLNAIKHLVTPDKAEIIDKIIELYVQGKI